MLTINKETGKIKGWRTLLQGAVAVVLLALLGFVQEIGTDTAWQPEWLLPWAPGLAGFLSYLQNKIEDRN